MHAFLSEERIDNFSLETKWKISSYPEMGKVTLIVS